MRKEHPDLYTPTSDGSRNAFYSIVGRTARGIGVHGHYEMLVYLRNYLDENLEDLKPYIKKGFKGGN